MNEQLGHLQHDLGLDERGLAMALGVEKRTLTRWVSGDNYPQREARKRLQQLVELHYALGLMLRDMDAARTWLCTARARTWGTRSRSS